MRSAAWFNIVNGALTYNIMPFMIQKTLEMFLSPACIYYKIQKHFRWTVSLCFDMWLKKGTEQKKRLAGWSTPFYWVTPATHSHTLAWATLSIRWCQHYVYCSFPFWLNHSNAFDWKGFCILFRPFLFLCLHKQSGTVINSM